MNHTKKVGDIFQDDPDVGVLNYDDPQDEHFTFFKSACKEHLFSLTKNGKIYEVCTNKKLKFKLVRVL